MNWLRAFLLAFFGALAWFVWAAASETSSSCFAGSHFLPWAGVALGAVISVDVVFDVISAGAGDNRMRWRVQPELVVGRRLLTGALTALGLAVALLFVTAIGCSA